MGFIPSRLYFRHKQLSILTKFLMVHFEVFFWADAGWKGDFKVRIYWCITSVPIFQLFCHKRSYKGLMLEISLLFYSLYGGQFMFSTEWLTLNYLLSHQHSTTVSLETYPLYSVTEFISATAFTGNFVKK